MKYIVQTLRFQDGKWDNEPLDHDGVTGYGNWRVVAVINTQDALNGIYYLTCLIEDNT